jgi:predicted NBD/HSP70 family sugar kinase
MSSEVRPLNSAVPPASNLVAAGAPSVLRTMNQRLLLDLLFSSGPVTRPQLARQSGLSQPTVIAALADLEDAGLVKAVGHARTAPGRAPMVYDVDPAVGAVIGVDIGREWLRLLITDLAGNRLCKLDERNTARDPDVMMDAVVDLVRQGTGKASIGPEVITHTVVGSPGVYGADSQQLRFAANLPGWGRLAVAAALRERLTGELTVENDANLAALGEYTYGAGRASRQFVYLTIGTGVGVGIVLDGKLYRGSTGSAGEIGHLPVGSERPPPRRDGSPRGMLEESFGASALVRRARAVGMKTARNSASIFAAARAGDPLAMDVVLAEGKALAYVVASICALLDPELIVVGGGIGQNLDLLTAGMAQELEHLTPARPAMAVGDLGREAVVLGAIALGTERAREAVFTRRIRVAAGAD